MPQSLLFCRFFDRIIVNNLLIVVHSSLISIKHQVEPISFIDFHWNCSIENGNYYLKLEYLNSTNGNETFPIRFPREFVGENTFQLNEFV